MKGKAIVYSDAELAWIKDNQAGISRKELTRLFNNKFNRNLATKNIHALCKRKGWSNGRDGRFKPGQKSWNKGKKGYMGPNRTSFKKGQVPHNHKPIGHERITKDGYIMIKTAEPKTFRLKHVVEWEKHNGPVPAGHNLRFLDNDPTNCSIDNLMLVPKAVNAVINKRNPANTGNKDFNEAIILTELLNHKVKKIGENGGDSEQTRSV